MQVREITISYGAKINVGDFNSVHIEISATALVEEGDDAETCRTELLASAKEAVRAEARELMKKPKAKVAEVIAGLPVDVANQLTN